jgi:GNAT superfamily N-acetyltransferase
MITYREATFNDTEPIAQLHSLSWQQNYRGIWHDDFLMNTVFENRRVVWQSRLQQPDSSQYVIVAESDQTICGFACAYVNNDPIWGTLLDNLHVHQERKGQGVGTRLMQLAARWAYHKNPESEFYLWVLAQNSSAQKFYDHMGGTNQELMSLINPDGSFSDCYRYVWPDLKNLL